MQVINTVSELSIIARRIARMMGYANITWMPAVMSGRKKTVKICVWIACFTSFWLRPTCCMVAKRFLSSIPSEICL